MQKRIYVKVDDYKDVVETLELAKSKLAELSNIIKEIEKIKEREDNELENWKSKIEEIGNKLEFIDLSLKE